MWYLQTDTFLLICLYCFALAMIRKLTLNNKSKLHINITTFIMSVVVIFIIDINLGIFYISYVLIGLFLGYVLYNIKKGKKALFILFSIAVILPIFIIRSKSLGIELPFTIVGIGFSFNMLKLIDTFFYIYYAEQKIHSLTYLNYMFFIPVFTSGPIFRYRDFIKTHDNPIILKVDDLINNIKRIIRGMFKKIVLFQVLMIVQVYILQLEIKASVSLILTGLSWFLLYFDLSGYSDIAIGFSKIAGYNVPENFKKPWKAPSFTMFWRSWHCTLSDWIREHIYIVVSKLNLNRTYSAILAIVTMIIMALWHGFNIPYFLSGGIYLGLLLAIENLLGLSIVNKRKTKKSIFILRCFIVNFLFAINTLVFTIPSDKLVPVFKGFFKFLIWQKEYIMKKSTENILFLIILVSLFTAFDVYLSKRNPVSNLNLFYKNDYEKIILANDNKTNYNDIFYGNSTVISAFDEEKSTSSYVNFGIDYGKISDLTEMIKKGYITVEDNIVIGLNYFTLMDTLDTNPTYPWYRCKLEPYLYFQRDRLYNFIESNINSLLRNSKLSNVRYDNLNKSVYYGKLTEEQLAEKIKTHKSLFWDLGMENYEKNFNDLQYLADYCKENGIRIRAVWMPWYNNVEIPQKSC